MKLRKSAFSAASRQFKCCGMVHLNFGVAVINLTLEDTIAVTETLQEVSEALRKHLHAHDPVNADQATLDSSGYLIYGNFQAKLP